MSATRELDTDNGIFEVQAACGHVISPERDDMPPCLRCDRCEACCPHICPVCQQDEDFDTCTCVACGEVISNGCTCEEQEGAWATREGVTA